MSLSMCILWLPVIWLSRRVFPYVSVFKHGGSHPLWSCCLLGKFLWTKISELPKVISIQEILVDVGFEYKCKSWILAALYNPAFCYWFCSPNLYWSRNNTTTWNDSEGIFLAFFFCRWWQPAGVFAWPRLVVVPLIFADVCLMHARRPGPGKHWGETEVAGGVWWGLLKRQPAPNCSPLGRRFVKQRSAEVDFLYHMSEPFHWVFT